MKIRSLREMLNSLYWDNYRNSLMIHMPLHDPERHNRIMELAEDGEDGSYHGEVIQDWREALECGAREKVIDKRYVARIEREINACEAWHEENGSLWGERE